MTGSDRGQGGIIAIHRLLVLLFLVWLPLAIVGAPASESIVFAPMNAAWSVTESLMALVMGLTDAFVAVVLPIAKGVGMAIVSIAIKERIAGAIEEAVGLEVGG